MLWLQQSSPSARPPAVLTFSLWSSFFLSFFFFPPTDSDADCSTYSQGGSSGLPQAVAGAHSHPAGVGEGSRRPAAAQGAAHLLPRHKNPGVQMSDAGQAVFPGCKSSVLLSCLVAISSISVYDYY